MLIAPPPRDFPRRQGAGITADRQGHPNPVSRTGITSVGGFLAHALFGKHRIDVDRCLGLSSLTVPCQLASQRLGGIFQLPYFPCQTRITGALREHHFRHHPVAFHPGEQHHGQPAAVNQRAAENKQTHEYHHQHITPVQAALQNRPGTLVQPALQTIVKARSQLFGFQPQPPRRTIVAQVGWQNPQRLHQRQQQDGHRDDGNNPHQCPFRPRQEQQGSKGKKRGHDRKQNRFRHPLRPTDSGLPPGQPLAALVVNAFAHDHRIIHHNPQHQNKGEQGDGVEGLAQQRQHGAGTEHAHGNPQCHPARQPQGQEDGQHERQQHQALQGVTPEQVGALTELASIVTPHL